MTTAEAPSDPADGTARHQIPAVPVRQIPAAPVRRWARTDATQQRILDAATGVFAAQGFDAATMADIVARSGASVGSIYHHFGGKRELFMAIFHRLTAELVHSVDAATQSADEQHTFEAGTRAYLAAMWLHRDAAKVIASGDTPAGFDSVRRSHLVHGFRRWMPLPEHDGSARARLLNQLLIAALTEASAMVIECDDTAEVAPIADAAAEWISRLTQ